MITGASSGIGAAAARLLPHKGTSVVLVARWREVLEAVAEQCGDEVLAVVGDMSSRADVRRVVEEALAHFGRIDLWVNNVGRGITRAPSQLTDEDIDEIMLVNVKSALYGMQEVLPQFRERGTGHVVNIASIFGLNARHGGPDSREPPYSQSAEEVAPVIVNAIEARRPDVYTRPGARQRVIGYYSSLGAEP